jgi:hypothetical protein
MHGPAATLYNMGWNIVDGIPRLTVSRRSLSELQGTSDVVALYTGRAKYSIRHPSSMYTSAHHPKFCFDDGSIIRSRIAEHGSVTL